MRKFKRIADLARAIQNGEIPADVVSPGAAAVMLGVHRQTLHDKLNKGVIECYKAEGVVLVPAVSIKAYLDRKKGIPETQGELIDAVL